MSAEFVTCGYCREGSFQVQLCSFGVALLCQRCGTRTGIKYTLTARIRDWDDLPPEDKEEAGP